jgi:hypothetical protein
MRTLRKLMTAPAACKGKVGKLLSSLANNKDGAMEIIQVCGSLLTAVVGVVAAIQNLKDGKQSTTPTETTPPNSESDSTPPVRAA